MAEENKVVLHSFFASPYAKRVELALRIKGIPFEYVEENLAKKSPELLKYNPVHKKVPVLVHNGKPVCESLVILEYLDEVWTTGPQLLPKEPYVRAKVRFWVAYIQQILQTMSKVFEPNNDGKDKIVEEVHEKITNFENGVKEFYFPDGCPVNISAEKLGLLDIMVFATFSSYKAQEQVLGVKAVDAEKTPLIFSWLQALNELPVIKESAVPHDRLVGLLQFLAQSAGSQ